MLYLTPAAAVEAPEQVPEETQNRENYRDRDSDDHRGRERRQILRQAGLSVNLHGVALRAAVEVFARARPRAAFGCGRGALLSAVCGGGVAATRGLGQDEVR